MNGLAETFAPLVPWVIGFVVICAIALIVVKIRNNRNGL
jgi:hypothetical protein